MRDRIAAGGRITVADYMAEAHAHYYATRDPFGAAGDFVTAPEISQMFGELVGIWMADLWDRAGSPGGCSYVELGPGRGTLAADALRAMAGAGFVPAVELVETSKLLRKAQASQLRTATWHDGVETLPNDGPLLIVANEFFDALPIHQYGADGGELMVALDDGRFVRSGTVGTERRPEAAAIAASLAERIVRQGGAMLIADYGHDARGTGDTLQAVAGHAFADPFEAPGERDLSAHVDFAALADAARAAGANVSGPIAQGAWLGAMGLGLRAEALARSAPARAEEIMAARDRLAAGDQMGRLFRVMAIAAPGWPDQAGF